MPGSDAVQTCRESLTTLAAGVLRIRQEYGDTLGVRRLTADVDRIAEGLDLLGDPDPAYRPSSADQVFVEIPDDPYDESMWQDAQSETQHAQ